MINYNGDIIAKEKLSLSTDNRAFKFGDALFETVKVKSSKVIFVEDHYFRLMASMRMLRMNIAMHFTLEFFESEILKVAAANGLNDARVRFSVNRKAGGLYLPDDNAIDFLIEASALLITLKENCEVDLFKDYYVSSGLLSTLKSNNKIINVVASIFAEENGLDNCILLNEHKHIVEAVNSNIFLVKDKIISTPSLSEGCLKGVIRKKLIDIINKDPDYEIRESEISPFELQKADEVFLTNAITGLQHITKYRKKTYGANVSSYFQQKLRNIEKLA